jgi:hypothetical protein
MSITPRRQLLLRQLLDEVLGPWETIPQILTAVTSTNSALLDISTKLDALTQEVSTMGQLEQAAAAQLETDIQAVATGWAAMAAQITSQASQITTLQAQLTQAGVDQANAVAAQASADDTQAASDITAGDTALQNLLNPPPAPPAGS